MAIQFVLLVGALSALSIYRGQLLEMRQSNKLMISSTDAATKAAKAAEASVALTRDNARLDQRAWVATTKINGQLDAGKPFISTVKFKNTGRTFARHTNVYLAVQLVDKGEDPDFSLIFEDRKNAGTFSTVLLAPNAENEVNSDPLDSSFSQEEIDKMGGKRDLFVFGRITYSDVFDRDHWTTFCFRYDIRARRYSVCNRHNDADNRSGE